MKGFAQQNKVCTLTARLLSLQNNLQLEHSRKTVRTEPDGAKLRLINWCKLFPTDVMKIRISLHQHRGAEVADGGEEHVLFVAKRSHPLLLPLAVLWT